MFVSKAVLKTLDLLTNYTFKVCNYIVKVGRSTTIFLTVIFVYVRLFFKSKLEDTFRTYTLNTRFIFISWAFLPHTDMLFNLIFFNLNFFF